MKKLNGMLAMLMAVLIISNTFSSCNKVKDKCEGVVCQNSGTCNEGNCSCTTGYEGTKCETKVNAKFAGTYTGMTNCGNGTDPETFPIEAQADPQTITIFLNSSHNITASVNGNSITIPVQNFPSGSENYRYSGTGTLNGNALSLTFYVLYSSVDPDLAYTCTYTGSK